MMAVYSSAILVGSQKVIAVVLLYVLSLWVRCGSKGSFLLIAPVEENCLTAVMTA